MTTIPHPRAIAGAAASLCLALPSLAAASDTIVGGQAHLCSIYAKADVHTVEAMQACTMALFNENLTGHDLAATYVNRATMEIGASSYRNALQDIDQALAVEPTLGAAYVNRGGALLGLGRFAESEKEIDKGLALNSEEPEKAYANRALARWHQDNVKGAYEDFMKASELKPDWAFPKEQLSHFKVTIVRRPAPAAQ